MRYFKCIGVPLKFDQNTVDGEYGHFARVLIDINLPAALHDSIILNKERSTVIF